MPNKFYLKSANKQTNKRKQTRKQTKIIKTQAKPDITKPVSGSLARDVSKKKI